MLTVACQANKMIQIKATQFALIKWFVIYKYTKPPLNKDQIVALITPIFSPPWLSVNLTFIIRFAIFILLDFASVVNRRLTLTF